MKRPHASTHESNHPDPLDKVELRRRFLGVRSQLSDTIRQTYSERICEHLLRWWFDERDREGDGSDGSDGSCHLAVGTVGLYAATRGEVNLGRFAEAVRRAGWRTAYPKANTATHTMTFYAVADEADLVTGAYGIREPRGEAAGMHEATQAAGGGATAVATVVAPDALTLLLVPGIAFAADGTRLGYGGGFYDRFLPKITTATVIGAAFACQQADVLPTDALDKPVQAIVTEAGIRWYT